VSGPFEYATSDPWNTDSNPWNTDTTIWYSSDIPLSQSSLLLASTAPIMTVVDVEHTFASVTYGASVERTGLTLDSPDQVKMLRSIVPRIDGQTGSVIYVQAGASMDVEGPYSWSDPVQYTIGTTRKADTFATGRFLAYRIYSTVSFPWSIRSIDLDVVPNGLH
jgi:hypothetical protein